MLNDLPHPIAAYLAANARLNADGMLAAFATDAVVKDEGSERRGREAIKAWIQSATIAARAVFTPDTVEREGQIVILEGPTAGDFPGSPIRFRFRFLLQDDEISQLEIA
jgi:hypothetical protein